MKANCLRCSGAGCSWSGDRGDQETPAAARQPHPRTRPEVADLLVTGPSADDEFYEFTLIPVEAIRALVRTHGAALQAEATRRGLRAAWAAVHYGRRS